MIEDTTSQPLPVFTAIDSGCSPAEAGRRPALGRDGVIINFFNDHYGAYPFDSTGAVVDRTTGVGYALEVQTKPHYATLHGRAAAHRRPRARAPVVRQRGDARHLVGHLVQRGLGAVV